MIVKVTLNLDIDEDRIQDKLSDGYSMAEIYKDIKDSIKVEQTGFIGDSEVESFPLDPFLIKEKELSKILAEEKELAK